MPTDTKLPATRTIDIHSHIYPEPYLLLLERRKEIPCIINRNGNREFQIFTQEIGSQTTKGRPMGPEYWDIEAKIAFMDKFSIDRSVISLGNPWMDPFPDASGDEAAVSINKILSGYEVATDGRLVGLGVLPTSSVEAAAESVKTITQTEGLYGAAVGPSIAGLQFDDPRLDLFWKEMANNKLPLFIHPENSLPLDTLKGFHQSLHFALGFPMETTIAIGRLVLGGVMARFPTLKIVVAHGGGCIPFLGGRLDSVHRAQFTAEDSLPNPPSTYLSQLYLDALVYYAPAFQAEYRLVGEEHLMFGTDHPFSIAEPEVNRITIQQELGDGEAYLKIMERNAIEIFGLKDRVVR